MYYFSLLAQISVLWCIQFITLRALNIMIHKL